MRRHVKSMGPHPVDVHIGARTRLRRMMLGMSQEKLAENLGVTFQQIQKREKGTNRTSGSDLLHTAQALGVPVSFFFEGAPGFVEPSAGASGTSTAMVDYLSSSEGIAINKAFIRIKDPRARRQIIGLCRILAGEAPEEAQSSGGGLPAEDKARMDTDGPIAAPVSFTPADQPVPWGQWGKRAHAAHV